LSVILIGSEEIQKLLCDPKWLSFNFGSGDFFCYLEDTFFTGKRNKEFEVIMGPAQLPEGVKITSWVRIKDTPQNRDCLRAALQVFFKKEMTREHVEKTLVQIRERLSNSVSIMFPV
jgi:hypothetical protein